MLLCYVDGQYQRGQDYFFKTTTTGSSVIKEVLLILRALLDDIPLTGQTLHNLTCEILDVAMQGFNTLNDMSQGPNQDIINAFLDCNIIPLVSDWLNIVTPLTFECIRFEKNLPKYGKEKLSSIADSFNLFQDKNAPNQKYLKDSMYWKTINGLCRVEASLVGLLTVICGSINAATVYHILTEIPMLLLIFRFKVCWCASVFKSDKHATKFFTGQYDESNEIFVKHSYFMTTTQSSLLKSDDTTFIDKMVSNTSDILFVGAKEDENSSEFSTLNQVWNYVYEIFNANKTSFFPDTLPLTEDDKNSLIRLWMHNRKLKDINIAFNYFQLLENLCAISIENVVLTLSHYDEETEKLKNDLRGIIPSWKQSCRLWKENTVSSFMTLKEVNAFQSYFGSVEIVLPSDELKRVFFPIPYSCRMQRKNPLVVREMEWTIETVNRDSAEERLDNFLDKSLQVKDVITFQHDLFSTHPLRGFFKVITQQDSLWVFCCLLLTSYINALVLKFSKFELHVEEQYLPSHIKSQLEIAKLLHLIFSGLLLINFFLGAAMVTIYRGLSYNSNVRSGAVALSVSSARLEKIYQLADLVLPEYLWYFYFLAKDLYTIYYCLFFTMSFLGYYYSVAFYAFHVIDVCVRIKLLSYVLKSVVININQVITTLLFGIVIIWLFTITGIYSFGYNAFYFDTNSDYDFPKTTQSKFWQFLTFGIGGSPIFVEYETFAPYKYLFTIGYTIIMVIIIVAIITGIIIDTFADLRQERNAIDDDVKNKCFICSLKREVFERNRLKFRDHIEKQHYVWNYLFYYMYLNERESTELSGIERNLKKLYSKQSITHFPIGRALALPRIKEDDEVMKELQISISRIEKQLETNQNKSADDVNEIKDYVEKELKKVIDIVGEGK